MFRKCAYLMTLTLTAVPIYILTIPTERLRNNTTSFSALGGHTALFRVT